MVSSHRLPILPSIDDEQFLGVTPVIQDARVDPEHLSRWVLGALYGPNPYRSLLRRVLWSQVDHCIRKSARRWQDVSEVLSNHGFFAEAMIWDRHDAHFWAELEVSFSGSSLRLGSNLRAKVRGSFCAESRLLTASCPDYPMGLRRLGVGAPPVLWQRGQPHAGPWVGIVGSREVPEASLNFARDAAVALVNNGFRIVSGGAVGIDQAAAGAALGVSGGAVLEFLPRGLDGDGCCNDIPIRLWQLSVRAPTEGFSREAAMERNTLTYALAQATVIVDARNRKGGSWWGAVSALQRHLGPVIVRDDPSQPGLQMLIALGGVPIRSPEQLPELLTKARDLGGLFSA